MSVLGNYIHLHEANYLKYGTAKKGETSQLLIDSLNAQRQANQQKINAITNVSSSTLVELKQKIVNESTQKEAMELAQDLTNYNKEILKVEQRVQKQLYAEVPSKFQEEGIRLIKKNVQINSSLVNIEEAKKARRRFYDNINTINKNFELGKPIQDNTIQTALNNCSQFFNCLGIVNNNLEFLRIKDLKNKNTVNALKAIVQSVSIDEANKAALHGTFGEVLVNMVADQMQIKAGKELKSAMQKALSTGEHRTSFQIDESFITPSVATAFQEKTGLNIYQIRATQDKVDASITINNQQVDASVKAYTPKGNIITAHLQDVSLVSSLAATQAQFANHWISLHSYKGMNHNEADNVMKTHIEYEALVAGNLLKQGAATANTFIVIDVKQGRVYAKSTKEILLGDNNFILNPSLNNIFFSNNKWANTWEQRIANILIELHKIKVSVMYKVNLT